MKKTKIDMDPVSVHARIKTVGAHVETCIEIEDNQMTCVPPPGAKSDKGRLIRRRNSPLSYEHSLLFINN